jgi:hypothetical protein
MENNQNKEASKSEPVMEKTLKEIHYHHYDSKKVNFGTLFLAILLISLGLLYLAKNTGWIYLDIDINWWQFWPVLIILLGLSMLSGRGWFSVAIGTIVIITTLAIIGFVIFGQGRFGALNDSLYNETISFVKETGINSAIVELKIGAAEVKIQGGSNELIGGYFKSDFLKLDAKSQLQESVQKVVLTGKSDWEEFKGGKTTLDLEVSSDTPMEFNMDAGAVNMYLDFSRVMADDIKINTGASKINLILGDDVENSKLDISGGASSVNILLPRTIGANVKIVSALSSRKLIDFQQIDSNNYQSNNYQFIDKKIDIGLSLGVSSLDINWY